MKIRGNDRGDMLFRCPGCDHPHVVYTQPHGQQPVWDWNGSFDAPTFSPSLLLQSEMWHPPVTHQNLEDWRRAPWPQEKRPYVCHSFVREGRIEFLPDCTHALAGQTVDLPDLQERASC